MACSFIAELSKLRKLSVESVENTTSFDEFKRYLHALRPVETELRDLLIKINGSNQKTLVCLLYTSKKYLLTIFENSAGFPRVKISLGYIALYCPLSCKYRISGEKRL